MVFLPKLKLMGHIITICRSQFTEEPNGCSNKQNQQDMINKNKNDNRKSKSSTRTTSTR